MCSLGLRPCPPLKPRAYSCNVNPADQDSASWQRPKHSILKEFSSLGATRLGQGPSPAPTLTPTGNLSQPETASPLRRSAAGVVTYAKGSAGQPSRDSFLPALQRTGRGPPERQCHVAMPSRWRAGRARVNKANPGPDLPHRGNNPKHKAFGSCPSSKINSNRDYLLDSSVTLSPQGLLFFPLEKGGNRGLRKAAALSQAIHLVRLQRPQG